MSDKDHPYTHRGYSRSDFERDLTDGLLDWDSQAKKEIKEGSKNVIATTVPQIRVKMRPVFNAAFERHIAK